MIDLWQLFSGGFLPESGGINDQAAAMLDAFKIMNHAAAEWKKIHGN